MVSRFCALCYTRAMSDFYEDVYRVVRLIPSGRVMTYGQIATILGAPRAARAVGYALRASKGKDGIPWQRVINHRGGISARSEAERPVLQEALLLDEGVVFGDDGTCDLAVYRWEPEDVENYASDIPDDLPFR